MGSRVCVVMSWGLLGAKRGFESLGGTVFVRVPDKRVVLLEGREVKGRNVGGTERRRDTGNNACFLEPFVATHVAVHADRDPRMRPQRELGDLRQLVGHPAFKQQRHLVRRVRERKEPLPRPRPTLVACIKQLIHKDANNTQEPVHRHSSNAEALCNPWPSNPCDRRSSSSSSSFSPSSPTMVEEPPSPEGPALEGGRGWVCAASWKRANRSGEAPGFATMEPESETH